MSSPRLPRSRPQPKAYTDTQLKFLKSHLAEYERRSQGVRGDAKRFALERAQDFIVRFGLPDDVVGAEASAKYKETLYCWYKNTTGRNRRKAEGKSKPAVVRKPTSPTTAADKHWDEQFADQSPPNYDEPYAAGSSGASPTVPVQYTATVPSSTLAHALHPSPSPPPPPPPPIIPPPVTVNSLRDAFLNGVDAPIIASNVQSFVLANPSQLPLNVVMCALFQAISSEWDRNSTPPNVFLLTFLTCSKYFTAAIHHAGVIGPMAGVLALHMHIRKAAKWTPTSTMSAPGISSMSAELQRITLDRARRKDHILWARIHAAALDVGVFTFGYEQQIQQQQQQQSSLSSSLSTHSTLSSLSSHSGIGLGLPPMPPDVFNESRVYSELLVADSVWEDDEVEWVSGALILQALIRSYLHTLTHTHNPHLQHMRGDKRRKYEELVARYEERWKDMKDEARQAIVTDALLAAKTDLVRLGP